MAFATGMKVGILTTGSYGASKALSWELSCCLKYLGYLIGQVMKAVLPILSISQLLFSSAANGAPFVAIGGTVSGLIIGSLVVNNLIDLIRACLQTPGLEMELMYHVTRNQ